MNTVVPTLSLTHLIIACMPAAIVVGIMFRWQANAAHALYASVRMLVQLFLIGYVLIYLFETDHFGMILGVLAIMLGAAAWISVQALPDRDETMFADALGAIALGSVPTLFLVTQWVLDVEPWFSPRHTIPLAGMIFAGAMNTVSLAAERLHAELQGQQAPESARRTAFKASMIPITNSFFAVGLVSLPGMMTGQVLSGVSPLIAAKYQIVVMAMLFGASGMSSAIYLKRRGTRH